MMVEKLPSKNYWSVGDICSTFDDISVSCADQTGPPNMGLTLDSHHKVTEWFLYFSCVAFRFSLSLFKHV